MNTAQAIADTRADMRIEAAGEKPSAPPRIQGSEYKQLLLSRRLQWLCLLHASAGAVDEAPALRDHKALKDVERALARIADGSFGRCLDCGDEIGRVWLRIDPVASVCRDCAQPVRGASI